MIRFIHSLSSLHFKFCLISFILCMFCFVFYHLSFTSAFNTQFFKTYLISYFLFHSAPWNRLMLRILATSLFFDDPNWTLKWLCSSQLQQPMEWQVRDFFGVSRPINLKLLACSEVSKPDQQPADHPVLERNVYYF